MHHPGISERNEYPVHIAENVTFIIQTLCNYICLYLSSAGMTEIQCCLDHQIVDLFHKIVVSSYSSNVQSFIKYQLTLVLLSQLRASGISSVPKKQGIVIENLANTAYFIPTRGLEE